MERSGESHDIIIAGGGTSGAALAGIIARDTDLKVLLLEAGPDYGQLSDGGWPEDLLDARSIPNTHDWGYSGIAHDTQIDPTTFDRARVIGGCSSHNGCVALGGHRRDYDHWAELGNTGWDWESIAPAFERAKERLAVRIPGQDELVPYQSAFLEAAVAAGLPLVADLNDPDDIAGVAPSPANIRDGMRWNTALAYLDPVRKKGNLNIIGNVLIDRVVIENGRAVAIEGIIDGQRHSYRARRIVLAAGAYGSPAILLRSGIGAGDELGKHGIETVQELAGVGRNLADHPAVRLRYRGGESLTSTMTEFKASSWLPDEQVLAKARSSRCTEAFDLHIYPTTSQDPDTGEWHFYLYVSSIIPRSSGTVTLRSPDPQASPLIDHGYLSDLDGEDRAVLADGLSIGRAIMQPLLDSGVLAEEISPGHEVITDAAVSDFINRTVGIYYHPACSCRMGPAGDPEAVVDPHGKVHGLEALYVCDASIFPLLMRANTNLPAAMIAEHLASIIADITG
jgi:choline dehydrogenase